MPPEAANCRLRRRGRSTNAHEDWRMSLAQNSKGKNGSAVRVRPTAKPVKPVKPARRKRPVAKHKPVIREILHAIARESAPAKEVHAPFPIAPFNPPIFPD